MTSNQNPSLDVLAARIARLERDNRRLKRFGLALLLAAGAVAVMGQSRPPVRAAAVLEARKFVLRDAKGKRRAELGLFPDRPGLVLFDDGGAATAVLGAFEKEEGLALLAGGERQVTIGTGAAGPTVALYSAAGVRRLNMSVL